MYTIKIRSPDYLRNIVMFFKQKSNCYIQKNYKSFDIFSDNRNFGYQQTNNNKNYIGETKLYREVGKFFCLFLGRKPQTTWSLVKKINSYLQMLTSRTNKKRCREFYCSCLNGMDFIVSGKTFEECNEKAQGFFHTR